MPTITKGVVRPCCHTLAQVRILADTPQLTTRQCIAPAEDGLLELDGVRVCGRKHYRAKLIGLDARAHTGKLGG